MALYEAIRQGQVKIAKGLESGQMRSDGIGHSKPKSGIPDSIALFKNKEKSPSISTLSKILAVVCGLAAMAILLFGIWLVIHLTGGSETVPTTDEPANQSQMTQGNVGEKIEPAEEESSGFMGFGGKKASEESAVEKQPAQPTPYQGPNVIVIQQIPPDQQDKLLPVQEYYNAKGIATEMIQRSGYTLLVTKAGFDYDPKRQGTDGYRLLQRIRQLGLTYPEATGDTKFGLRPFQDAYGYKR
ncbi:MAG: hypothetical protein ISS71_01180 [Phycisphaerae bacterium]|nr:hypothetical protein [Phycisphaerae bacterium]